MDEDPVWARLRRADYVTRLRPLLPARAFRPNARAYVPITIHVVIIICAWIACHYSNRLWWPLITVVIGNSMSCLAILAHDVSHRSVTRNRHLLYPTELVLFGLILLPPTLWRRLHAMHHAHLNTSQDPERRYLASELSLTGTIVAAALYPNKPLRFNPLCLLYWVAYPIRHGIAALLYRERNKPDFVTAKPRYSAEDKRWIAFEILWIATLQIGLATFVGKVGLIAVSVLPLCITSAVLSWYFFVTHGLKPIAEGDDTLAASTSLILPALCDKLHSNFSYHTEHHLFPAVHPIYYPAVSALLHTHFPHRYHRVPIFQAWSGLLQSPIAAPEADASDRERAAPANSPTSLAVARSL